MKTVRRGYKPAFDKYFDSAGVLKLKEAGIDFQFLLNRGYRLKTASNIVQNHYLLPEDMRIALCRSVCSDLSLQVRSNKIQSELSCKGAEVWIDGFNTIIPLESFVSNSPIFIGRDSCIRDLASLSGNYHIIDKTEKAIKLMYEELERIGVSKVNIFLDKPMSNSGRLKVLLAQLHEDGDYSFSLNVELLNACDKSLYDKDFVISGDAIILDNCNSWIPLSRWIIEDYANDESWLINFEEGR